MKQLNLQSDIDTKVNGLLSENIEIANCIKNSDLIINATPIGMYNSTNKEQSLAIPLGRKIWENLQPNTILYDLVYTPRPTEWLKLGKVYGCQQIDGLEMLIQQGAASLKLWSGINVMPTEIMRKAAESILS